MSNSRILSIRDNQGLTKSIMMKEKTVKILQPVKSSLSTTCTKDKLKHVLVNFKWRYVNLNTPALTNKTHSHMSYLNNNYIIIFHFNLHNIIAKHIGFLALFRVCDISF
jgi:hypothetical protein